MPDALGSNSGQREFTRLMGDMIHVLQRGERLDLERVVREHPRFTDQVQQLKPALDLLAAEAAQKSPVAPNGDPASPPQGQTERVLGDYRLLREIGRGGMGIVYEAVQISLDRRVALKILPFAGVLDDRALRRFTNEARAAAQLQHPHIVPVTFIGCDRGVHYYVMQYVEGVNLFQVIRGLRQQLAAEQKDAQPTTREMVASGEQHAPEEADEDSQRTEVSPSHGQNLSDRERTPDTSDLLGVGSTKRSSTRPEFFLACARLGFDVAEALQHAHDMGVIHRDIKPSNLLLDKHGAVWVTDFGLAQIAGSPAVTVTGDVLGTLRYMSPEQALAKRVVIDHRTDVYSLGATLYELLTSRPVFDGENREQILRQIAFSEPVRPRKLNPHIPRDLETIVLKALEKNPDERYQTAADLARNLKLFRDDLPIDVRPPTLAHRSKKWLHRHQGFAWSAATVALLIFVGSLVSAALIWRALGKATTALASEKAAKRELADTLRRSEGLRLAVHSSLERPNNPGLATLLAIEAAKRRPGLAANQALLAAVDELHEAKTLIGHASEVGGARFSSDGRRAVTTAAVGAGAENEPAMIWDVASGKLLRKLDDGTRISGAVFSPDGGRVLTSSTAVIPPSGDKKIVKIANGPLSLWDAVTGQKLQTLEGAVLRDVHAAAFDRAGRRLVAPAEGHSAKIWDVIGGHVIRELPGHAKPVIYAAFDPTGLRVATVASDRTVRIWNAESGAEVSVIDFSQDGSPEPGWTCSIDFSPDGAKLITGAARHGAQLWDVETGEQLNEGQWPGSLVRFSPGGERVYAYSRFGELQARDVRDGRLVYSIQDEPRGITFFNVSPDGRHLLTSADDSDIRVWNATTGQPEAIFRGHEGKINAAAFSSNGRRVISAANDKTARVWNIQSGAQRDLFRAAVANRSRPFVAFSPDSKTLLVLTESTSDSLLWDLAEDRRLTMLPGRPARSGAAQAHQITIDGDRIRLWDLQTRVEIGSLQSRWGEFRHAALGPDGALVAAIVDNGPTWIWDPKTNRKVELVGHSERVVAVAFHPEGKLVATASADGRARIFDPTTGELRVALPHDGEVREVLFDRIGNKLLTVAEFGRARVWDWAAGKVLAAVEVKESQSLAARFSRDGRYVFTFDILNAGAVASWDAATGKFVRDLKGAFDVVHVAENPLAPELLIGSNVSGAMLWNYETGDVHKLTGEAVAAAAFSQSGAQLAIVLAAPRVAPEFAPLDGPALTYGGSEVQVYNSADRSLARAIRPSKSEIRSLRFAPGDASLVLETQSYGAALFDVAQGSELARFAGHAAPVSHAMFSPDGRQVVTTSWDETAIVWDVETGNLIRRMQGHTAPLTHCAISSDGRLIATASTDMTCRLWEVGRAESIGVLAGHTDQVWRVAFSADDKRLLTVSRDKTVRVWDRLSKQSTAIQEEQGLIAFAEFAPADDRLLTMPGDEIRPLRIEMESGPPLYMVEPVTRETAPDSAPSYEVKLFKELGAIPAKLPHEQPPRIARFSPDGKTVLTVTAAGEALLWNAADGRKVRTFAVPGAPIGFAAFSRDGKKLLTDHEHEIAVWSVQTGDRLLSVADPNGFSFGVSWPMEQPYEPLSPDGKWLATVSKSGDIRKSPLDPLSTARAAAPRKLTADERSKFEISSAGAPRPAP